MGRAGDDAGSFVEECAWAAGLVVLIAFRAMRRKSQMGSGSPRLEPLVRSSPNAIDTAEVENVTWFGVTPIAARRFATGIRRAWNFGFLPDGRMPG